MIDPLALTRPESVSLDKWEFRPLMARGLRPTRQTEPTFVFAPAVGAEVITADKWLAEIAQPLRRRRQAAQAASVIDPVALTRAEAVSIDRWLFSAPAPVRRPLAPRISVTVVLAPVPDMTWLDWPVPPAPAATRRAQAPASPFVPSVGPESILLDTWQGVHAPVPRRMPFRRALDAIIDPAAGLAATSIDHWFFDSLPPVRHRVSIGGAISIAPTVVTAVPDIKGFHTLSDSAGGPGVSDAERNGLLMTDAAGGPALGATATGGPSVSSGRRHDWSVSDS